MLKQLIYFAVLSVVLGEDELLESLYGKTGKNRLTLCADEGIECEGALWKNQWVVTRSTCLSGVPLYQVAVMKGKNQGCEKYVLAIVRNIARTVRVRFSHPDPDLNISLLFLDIPYPEVEALKNASIANELLSQIEPWMQKTIRSYEPEISYVNPYARKAGTFSSPVRMFVSTVVLPSAAFIVFFLFVMFFTRPHKNTMNRNYTVMKETSSV